MTLTLTYMLSLSDLQQVLTVARHLLKKLLTKKFCYIKQKFSALK